MRRFLVSLTALGLLGIVVGCRVIGEGIDSDCCCDSCGCAGGGCDAPPMGPATAPPINHKPGTPGMPESIKEMPKATETSVIKDGASDGTIRLTPEPEGLDLLK